MRLLDAYNLGGVSFVSLLIAEKLTKRNMHSTFLEALQAETLEEEYPLLVERFYKFETGKRLDLNNPQSFNEKIQWLKIYDNVKEKTLLADKYLVREWVKKRIGEQYLIPLLGVWDSADEIDFDSLPSSFVIKGNHGCGMNIIVKDKSLLDRENVKQTTDKWLKTNYAYKCGLELQYKNIKPVILAEEYIEQLDNNLLDYKIHCFSGVPRLVQIIGDRDIVAHKGKEIVLNTKWERTDMMYNTYDAYTDLPYKPDNFDEMLFVAEKLSSGFRYVRVDLYNIEGKILFGEMTFTPYSGFGKWKSEEAALEVGSWIDIS